MTGMRTSWFTRRQRPLSTLLLVAQLALLLNTGCDQGKQESRRVLGADETSTEQDKLGLSYFDFQVALMTANITLAAGFIAWQRMVTSFWQIRTTCRDDSRMARLMDGVTKVMRNGKPFTLPRDKRFIGMIMVLKQNFDHAYGKHVLGLTKEIRKWSAGADKNLVLLNIKPEGFSWAIAQTLALYADGHDSIQTTPPRANGEFGIRVPWQVLRDLDINGHLRNVKAADLQLGYDSYDINKFFPLGFDAARDPSHFQAFVEPLSADVPGALLFTSAYPMLTAPALGVPEAHSELRRRRLLSSSSTLSDYYNLNGQNRSDEICPREDWRPYLNKATCGHNAVISGLSRSGKVLCRVPPSNPTRGHPAPRLVLRDEQNVGRAEGDWAPGRAKRTCPPNHYLSGLSFDQGSLVNEYACLPSPVIALYGQNRCYTRWFDDSDSRATTDGGDFAPYERKGQCHNNEYAAGYALRVGAPQIAAMLCCPF